MGLSNFQAESAQVVAEYYPPSIALLSQANDE